VPNGATRNATGRSAPVLEYHRVCGMVCLACCIIVIGYTIPLNAQPSPPTQERTQGVIRGILIDEYGSTVPKTPISLTTWMFPRTSDSDSTDFTGRFSCSLPSGSYHLTSFRGLGLTDQAAARRSDITITAGDTTWTILDAKWGAYLEFSDILFNGRPPPLEVSGSSSFTVECNYHIWAPRPVPDSDQHIAVGIEGKPHDTLIIGTPGTYPGIAGRVEFAFSAPDSTGTYRVLARHILFSDRNVLLDLYEKNIVQENSRNIYLGSIHVRPKNNVIAGCIVDRSNTVIPGFTLGIQRIPNETATPIDTCRSSFDGTFSLPAEDGRYSLIGRQTERRMLASLGDAPAFEVAGADSIWIDLDSETARFFQVDSFRVEFSDSRNIAGTTHHLPPGYQISPSDRISLELTCHRWGGEGNSTDEYVVVGMNGQAQDVRLLKDVLSSTGNTGTLTINLRAPEASGSHEVYLMLLEADSAGDAIRQFDRLFSPQNLRAIRLLILRVRD